MLYVYFIDEFKDLRLGFSFKHAFSQTDAQTDKARGFKFCMLGGRILDFKSK